jgi:hypothetical protein
MAGPGGSSGGALMEKSKLSLKQNLTSRQPSLEVGGGGGGIGNKVINGGGGGGDDDDDDEYFQEDDGEDPNESKWWHKVPLKQLYDAATVRAVLSVRPLCLSCIRSCTISHEVQQQQSSFRCE